MSFLPSFQGHSIKGGLLLHLKSQLQLIRLHLNRSTSHQRAVLAMLSEAFEDLCSPAIDATALSYRKEGNSLIPGSQLG